MTKRPRLTSDSDSRYSQCMDEALRVLDRASVGWSHGDPSDPDRAVVLASILAPFVRERFLRPPNGTG
jgi:hypothetical protein